MAVRLPLLVLTSLAATGWSADRYVSGGGADGNSGLSAGAAYRTLAKAATVVEPGDTVWILDGTYAPFTITRSGTAAAPITWKAHPGHAPELRSSAWNAISVNASWQVIDGLILTGNKDEVTLAQAEADFAAATPSGVYNGNGILLDNRGKSTKHHHLTVRNCVVRRFCGGGIATIEADYTVIEGCDISENAWYSRYGCSGATIFPHNAVAGDPNTGYRNIIRGNRFWNNRGLVMWKGAPGGAKYSDGNGFILDITAPDYAGRTLICNNLAFNNGGSGIHAYKGVRADIVNNTAYHNGQVVGYPDIFANSSTDVRLLNNVVVSMPGGKANSNSGNTNVVYDYNVYFAGTRAITGPHDLVADPLFVNASTDPAVADFRLRAGSPALDSGTGIAGTTPLSDLLGVGRPQGAAIDRGAYEAAVDTTPPATPAAPVVNDASSPTPRLSGSTEPGATVRIRDGGALIGTVTADAVTGAWTWTVSPALGIGSHALTVVAVDGAGNASAASPATTVTVAAADTTPPATPAAPGVSDPSSATPTLSGTTEPGAQVRIADGATLLATVTADGGGTWSWTVAPPLAAGSHALTVTARDGSGNTSAASPAAMVTVAGTGGASPLYQGDRGGGSGGCGFGAGSALALIAALGLTLRGRAVRQG